jgi:hypothetical protein
MAPAVASSNTEHHYLRNTGTIHQKFYVRVQLPNGHQTSIPVINGKLPRIAYYTNNYGRVNKLVCDYAIGRSYTDYRGRSIIQYGTVSGNSNYGQGKKAPAPRHPDSKQRGVSDKAPAPSPDRVTPKAPAPISPDLEKRGANSESFDEILKRLEHLQEHLEQKKPVVPGDMKRPSDIKEAPAPHLPTYD